MLLRPNHLQVECEGDPRSEWPAGHEEHTLGPSPPRRGIPVAQVGEGVFEENILGVPPGATANKAAKQTAVRFRTATASHVTSSEFSV